MTNAQSILKTSLLDLLYELRGQQGPMILAGGYGLFLKQVHLQQTRSSPSLIPGEFWPAPRATEDLDILLRTEVVVDANQMRAIRTALDRLGYTVIQDAKYMQFAKQVGGSKSVKIDLLTGPLGSFQNDSRVRVDKRRVRPRESVHLHAHRTDEALGFQDHTIPIAVPGTLSSGVSYEATVYVPSAFTLLLMKLYAFRDRCQDGAKDFARHHAIDIYRIVAMMSEDEFASTCRQAEKHKGEPVPVEANRIIFEYFRDEQTLGSLRLREHPLWDDRMPLGPFLSALKDAFTP